MHSLYTGENKENEVFEWWKFEEPKAVQKNFQASPINYETWSDACVTDNVLYYYRLVSTNGIVLSNTVSQFISDTAPPEITVHYYGSTDQIDVSLPVNGEYIEYGATAIDLVDPNLYQILHIVLVREPSFFNGDL